MTDQPNLTEELSAQTQPISQQNLQTVIPPGMKGFKGTHMFSNNNQPGQHVIRDTKSQTLKINKQTKK